LDYTDLKYQITFTNIHQLLIKKENNTYDKKCGNFTITELVDFFIQSKWNNIYLWPNMRVDIWRTISIMSASGIYRLQSPPRMQCPVDTWWDDKSIVESSHHVSNGHLILSTDYNVYMQLADITMIVILINILINIDCKLNNIIYAKYSLGGIYISQKNLIPPKMVHRSFSE